jgi:glycosyltransferase A (GT-A) superfamily protein (DUF2064 family)
MRQAVVLIAKEPSAPHAKTRLAATVGRDAASRLAMAMLLDSGEALAANADADVDLVLYHDPPDAMPRVLTGGLPARFRGVAQPPGGLGHRLAHITTTLLAQGYATCSVVAADSPHGVLGALEEARPRHPDEIVLGPCEDGGYWVVGLARPAAIFDVAMSTPDVLAATIERARSLGRDVRLLAPLLDFDTWDDLLAAERRGLLAAAVRTRHEVASLRADVA